MKKIWILASCGLDNEVDKIPLAYIKAIEDNWDFLVCVIPCVSKNIDIYIQELDGFLIPGGQSDVDPALYWEINQGSNHICSSNDAVMIEIIRKILKSWKPILWICRGMQLINVALWWSLFQDISNVSYGFDVIHTVTISEDSRLFEIYKKHILWVNSLHHQAVNALGRWLFPVAYNEGKFVEAIENDNGTIVWVQWHPEYLEGHWCLFKDMFE